MRLPERARRWLVSGLVVLAAQQLAAASWIHVKAALAQVLVRHAWSAALADGQRHKPWPWADTWPVARLRVPQLGIDQIVLAGASGNALAFGPGLDEGGAVPGSAGTAVIGGHRDTHFAFLRELRAGGPVLLQTPDGRWRYYRVAEAAVVDSRSVTAAPRREGAPVLELVTCYPFEAWLPGGPLRYVVTAMPQPAPQRVHL
ncbi:class GN sortase [Mangrovimicrobium sediminis]|uniref:Class GN sortase n=1 Tax=Mangrovimicrobium sediminis TaxID=2562682 RepID=A0A4Z0M224_9GAMM|nr:class GN sortase [Haliea sp. SAOS-164]TGD73530.1 class GN sortase [Haliea sp. SAOS-164]